MDKSLRFGDILKGYIATFPCVEYPFWGDNNSELTCQIKVSYPKYVVVMTPCCSIKDKLINLVPVLPISKKLAQNPYFSADFTRINREIKPEFSVPPVALEKMSPDDKEKLLSKGISYSFLNLFVYDQNPLFSSYIINETETNCYMIDFKQMYSLECSKIMAPDQSPIESKVLQLSISARSELRQKLVAYLGRVPEEDRIV